MLHHDEVYKEYSIQEFGDGAFRGVVRDSDGGTSFITEKMMMMDALNWLSLMVSGSGSFLDEDTILLEVA